MRIGPVEGYRNISHRAHGRFEFYAPYFEISDVGRHGSVGRLIRGRERQANILRVEKLKRILVGCVKSSDVEPAPPIRSEEHTSELQSLMRISYAVFCLKKKKKHNKKKAMIRIKKVNYITKEYRHKN